MVGAGHARPILLASIPTPSHNVLRQAAHYYTPCNVDDLRKRAPSPSEAQVHGIPLAPVLRSCAVTGFWRR